MGKWKPLYDSCRKYKKEWEKEKQYPWLRQASDGSEFAYCKLCTSTVLPKLSSISAHEGTDKHKKHAPSGYSADSRKNSHGLLVCAGNSVASKFRRFILQLKGPYRSTSGYIPPSLSSLHCVPEFSSPAAYGNVVAKGGERFEWIIPHIQRKKRMWYWSPNINTECGVWRLGMYPNGSSVNTRILFWLRRIFSINWKSLRCTVGLKRADHSEETIGTETCGGYDNPSYILNKMKGELENEGCLLNDQLTVTLLFGEAHVPRGFFRQFFSLW